MKLTDIDQRDLERLLREMSERSVMYASIKRELKRRGHWKNLSRGRSFTTADGKLTIDNKHKQE